MFPDKNFIGIDVKGARMWSGAKQSLEEGLTNVAFLRTDIELIHYFFAVGEIAEIWITFPDPQMNKVRKRLTSTRFMELYRQILTENGVIHLKSDSNFLFTYTRLMVAANGYTVLQCTDDLYHSELVDPILHIKTYYEQQWLNRGLNIKYIKFVCEQREKLIEPDQEIEFDDYRSFHRGRRSDTSQKQS
jgi:tRNA (guanine-N7-)-methyltransferase